MIRTENLGKMVTVVNGGLGLETVLPKTPDTIYGCELRTIDDYTNDSSAKDGKIKFYLVRLDLYTRENQEGSKKKSFWILKQNSSLRYMASNIKFKSLIDLSFTDAFNICKGLNVNSYYYEDNKIAVNIFKKFIIQNLSFAADIESIKSEKVPYVNRFTFSLWHNSIDTILVRNENNDTVRYVFSMVQPNGIQIDLIDNNGGAFSSDVLTLPKSCTGKDFSTIDESGVYAIYARLARSRMRSELTEMMLISNTEFRYFMHAFIAYLMMSKDLND